MDFIKYKYKMKLDQDNFEITKTPITPHPTKQIIPTKDLFYPLTSENDLGKCLHDQFLKLENIAICKIPYQKDKEGRIIKSSLGKHKFTVLKVESDATGNYKMVRQQDRLGKFRIQRRLKDLLKNQYLSRDELEALINKQKGIEVNVNGNFLKTFEDPHYSKIVTQVKQISEQESKQNTILVVITDLKNCFKKGRGKNYAIDTSKPNCTEPDIQQKINSVNLPIKYEKPTKFVKEITILEQNLKSP